MHIKVAGKEMDFMLNRNGMVQLFKNRNPYSSPITTGEAGIFQDANGNYFYTPVEEKIDKGAPGSALEQRASLMTPEERNEWIERGMP
jgi:hypothetical protein